MSPQQKSHDPSRMRTSSAKIHYIYTTEIENHNGLFKYGQTDLPDHTLTLKDMADIGKKIDGSIEYTDDIVHNAAANRVRKQGNTVAVSPTLLWCAVAIRENENGDLVSFTDHDVHNALIRGGVKRNRFEDNNAREWFVGDPEVGKAAFFSIQKGEVLDSTQPLEKIVLRDEQRACVSFITSRYLSTRSQADRKGLMNCIMRFGKTLTALTAVAEIKEVQRVLVLTHRPGVEQSWFDDANKLDLIKRIPFFSKNYGTRLSSWRKDTSKGLVFTSLQHLRHAKIDEDSLANEILNTEFDMIIVDEGHEGTETELAQGVLSKLLKNKPFVLYISGTAFRINDKFLPEEVFEWSYVDERRAHHAWGSDTPNPYDNLPEVLFYTYNPLDDMKEVSNRSIVSIDQLFEVDNSEFTYPDAVHSFLSLISSSDKYSKIKTNYPFTSAQKKDTFAHTLSLIHI